MRKHAEMKAAAVGGGEASGGSPTAWRTPPAPPKRISPSGLPPSQKHCSPPGCRGRNRSSGGIAPSRVSPRSSVAVGLAAQMQLCSRESVGEQVSGESRQVRIAAGRNDDVTSAHTGHTVANRGERGGQRARCTTSIRLRRAWTRDVHCEADAKRTPSGQRAGGVRRRWTGDGSWGP